jgi:hypothetical protein
VPSPVEVDKAYAAPQVEKSTKSSGQNHKRSTVEALWALGAPEPKKGSSGQTRGLGSGGKGAENSGLEWLEEYF